MSDLREALTIMGAVELELRSAVMGGSQLEDQQESVAILRNVYANAATVVAWLIDRNDQLQEDPALQAEFRKRFSDMRAKVITFQSRWPPQVLRNPGVEFLTAANELVESNHLFVEWVDRQWPFSRDH